VRLEAVRLTRNRAEVSEAEESVGEQPASEG